MSFRVVSVSPDSIIGEEQLGSKTKFWFARGGERWLFKEGRAHTGEDWAEKVAAEIARLIGVEAARVELAEYGGRQGSASSSFVRPAENLIHGNEILGGMILGYDPTKRLHQSDHTLANIAASVRRLVGSDSIYENVLTTLAGYAVLDALICNTDRHHENWGFLARVDERSPGSFAMHARVAPSFDHASSLGRELKDEKRRQILRGQRIASYVARGRGGVYFRSVDRRGANPLELVRRGALLTPKYFQPPLQQLSAVPLRRIQACVDRVPNDRISGTGRGFARALLSHTYDSLVSLTHEVVVSRMAGS